MTSQNTHPVILVTGAASGIGLALAKKLVPTDYRIILTARTKSLYKFAENNITETDRILIRPLDVTNPLERENLTNEIITHWGQIDVLVNNAGMTYRSVIEHMTDQDEILQLQSNYLGPIALTRLVLPGMRQRRTGRIINISSVGGMMAMPTMGSYSASKFALEGASEALWYELRPWNIFVTLIQPGFVHSNSFRQVKLSLKAKLSAEDPTHPDAYTQYYTHMSQFIERLMCLAFATPESISTKILKTINDSNPPLRIPGTIDAYIFSFLRRFVPRRLYHWLLYRNLPGINEWGKQ